jgi:hypothetical protein
MISLPLKMGGMGLRPAERISASAYFSSAASILPDFLRAFPSQSGGRYCETELHEQLQACRALMEQQGVAGASSSPAPPSAAAQQKRGKSAPKSASSQLAAAAKTMQAGAAASPLDDSPQLKSSIDMLWSAAAAFNAAATPPKSAFLQAERVQRSATQLIEQHVLQQLHSSSSLRRQILLTANTTPHSSEFLTVLPTQPLYRMSNASLQMAVRHRLGVLPYDSLALQRCYCKERSAFAEDPDHFHSCAKHRRTLLNSRHDNIVQVLLDLARSVGFNAIREPNSHIRPDSLAQLPSSSVEYNRHADLLLLKHGLKLYVDVTITRPTKESTVNVARPGSMATHTPLFSTRAAAAAKHVKYDEIARVNEYRMVPFAMETYGGIAPEAEKLLRTMAAHSTEYSPSDFLLHAYKRLSVALQSSNADVAQLAMQHFHLRQHAARKDSYDAQHAIHMERVSKYAQAADGDQLARQLQPIVEAAEAQAWLAEDAAEAASNPAALAFVHERRVAIADITRSIDQAGLVSVAA